MAQKPFLKIAPWMTEKSLTRAGSHCYTFMVPQSANKPEIKKLVSRRFKVKVKKVNLQNRPRQLIRRTLRRGRTLGYQPGYKLAFVYLEKGETIEGYEIKEEKPKKKKSKEDEKKTT